MISAIASAWASDAATSHTDRLYKYWKYKIWLSVIIGAAFLAFILLVALLGKSN